MKPGRLIICLLALTLLATPTWHAAVIASGSGEDQRPTEPPAGPENDEAQPPDEPKPVDSAEVARGLYNEGVKKMNKAKDDWTKAKNDKDKSKAVKEFEKAADKYAEALKYRPNYPEALNNLGFSLRVSGRYEEAMKHYNQALALRPDFMEAHEYRGRAYLALDSVSLAKSEYQWLADHQHTDEAESLKVAIDAWVLARAEGKTISVEKRGW